MKRYYVIVDGRVQGVGFRWFCTNTANQLHLTGTVKNLYNGMVEIYVQGEEKDLLKFLATIRAGNNWIRVDDYQIKEVPLEPHEHAFTTVW